MNTTFNKAKEYEELIAPKVIELQRLCHMQKIPMFATFCIANNEKSTEYVKEMVSCATCDLEVNDNQIAKHVNVSLGFDTIQPSFDNVIDMDDMDVGYIEEEAEKNEDEEGE